ncbi:carbohydrate ABC transporter permease [Robinsoniella peoriensis]|uniref:carbohydrate ABC transporter permease n=1 Tax=Robinsoniella peoriensis TaxID=180332 RepID=UPI00159F052E|nr:sugar ABC transporter permease [Robinsoniella peoriensis]
MYFRMRSGKLQYAMGDNMNLKAKKKGKNWLPYLFILPAIVIFLFVYAGPMVATAVLGFTDWNGISPNFEFIGLKNFIKIFTDKSLQEPLLNTFEFTILTVVIQGVLALLLAVALNRSFRGRNLFRTVFFLPCVVSMVAVGYAWSLIFNPVMGPLGLLADHFGWESLSNIKWLSDPKIVMYSIVLVNVWQWTGYNMVIYLAGLQSIPNQLYEAASIDGANKVHQFFKITLPLVAPSITINTVMATMGGLKAFDLMYVMTNGGPGHASQTFAMASVDAFFRQKDAGLGSAMSLLMFLMILLVSYVQNRLLSKREVGVL